MAQTAKKTKSQKTSARAKDPTFVLELTHQMKILKEEEVFKPTNSKAHEDSWPTVPLDAVIIYNSDGEPANLLDAEFETHGFTVEGVLVIPEADTKTLALLRHGRYNNNPIATKSNGFAIGDPAATIWIRGQRSWFTLVPSDSYKEMFQHMTQGVELYFAIETVIGNELDENEETGLIDFMAKVGEIIGHGHTSESFLQLLMIHSKFLLSQMGRNKQLVNSACYKWLTTRNYATYRELCKNIKVKPRPNSLVDIESGGLPSPEHLESAPDTPKKSECIVRCPILPGQFSCFPGPVQSIVGLIYGALNEESNKYQDYTPHNMSLSTVAALINKNFRVKSETKLVTDHMFSKAIMYYYANSILDALLIDENEVEFFGTRLAHDLADVEFPGDVVQFGTRAKDLLVFKEVSNLKELTRRNENSRRLEGSRGSVEVSTEHGSAFATLPTESHSLPFGSLGGKSAGLRLPQSVKRGPSDFTSGEYSFGNEAMPDLSMSARPSKRPRPSSAEYVEMGEYDEVLDDVLAAGMNGDNRGSFPDSISHHTERLTLVSSDVPTGPPGTYLCEYADCLFTIQHRHSDEVHDAINAHVQEHYRAYEEQQELVRQEGARFGASNNYLLEHLKNAGKMRENRELDGVKTVGAIMRSNYFS